VSNDGIIEIDGEEYLSVTRSIEEYASRPALNKWARQGHLRRFYRDRKLYYARVDLEKLRASRTRLLTDDEYAMERRAQELAERFKKVSARKQLEVMAILGMDATKDVA
jgi:hypothetical protein